jgi:putative two-component system response regulator
MTTTSATTQNELSTTAPSRIAGNAASNYARMKILVVDDEPANVALLEEILLENGYTRVTTVTDARTVMDTYETTRPDLVLLDLMMPHIDGLTILETIRSQPGELFLPVLVLTADINEETKRRALRGGATDFLLKPFDPIEVMLRIANLLEIRRLNVQLDTQRAAYEEALRTRSSELREAISQRVG